MRARAVRTRTGPQPAMTTYRTTRHAASPRSRVVNVLAAIGAVLAFSGSECSRNPANPFDPSPDDPSGFAVRGQVLIDGNPAAGVLVTISSQSTGLNSAARTDASGRYSIDGVSDSHVLFTASVSGGPPNVVFDPATAQSGRPSALSDNAVVVIDFTGTAVGMIRGQVTVDGAPLSGVSVQLSTLTVTQPPQTTGQEGTYSFSPLTSGSYEVRITGFPSDVVFDRTTESVSLASRELKVVDFPGRREPMMTFVGDLRVLSDAVPPHDPAVFNVGSLKENVNVKLTMNGSTTTLEGQSGFAPNTLPSGLMGVIAADGSFSMSALGSIFLQIGGDEFEIENVSFDLEGTLVNDILQFTITVGANGGLPTPEGTLGADPVVYRYTGAK